MGASTIWMGAAGTIRQRFREGVVMTLAQVRAGVAGASERHTLLAKVRATLHEP